VKKLLTQKYWHELFEVGMTLKAFNGVWETVTGFLFLVLSKETLHKWFSRVFSNELLEDPHDKLIQFLTHTFQNVSSDTKTFAALYIFLHGILNIFLVVQLYRDKHWAYLVTIGSMVLFMIYQIHRISVHHSLFLTILTIFDALFIVLTWHEYKHHTEKVSK
jgi:uncharacterized membrane protein